MKKLMLTLGCCALLATAAFGQTTQSIKITTSGTSNTSGSFNPGSAFSLDTSATFTGFTGVGLSYFFQVPTALAPFITITSEQYFTWTRSESERDEHGLYQHDQREPRLHDGEPGSGRHLHDGSE